MLWGSLRDTQANLLIVVKLVLIHGPETVLQPGDITRRSWHLHPSPAGGFARETSSGCSLLNMLSDDASCARRFHCLLTLFNNSLFILFFLAFQWIYKSGEVGGFNTRFRTTQQTSRSENSTEIGLPSYDRPPKSSCEQWNHSKARNGA